MSHTIHYSLITFLAIALLVSVLIEKSHQPERGDTIESLLMTLPNDSESDHRKHATLVAACSSIADLIRSDSMKDTDEVIAAFHIETANLRTDNHKRWFTIQQYIETLLRQATSLPEQEVLLRKVQVFRF